MRVFCLLSQCCCGLEADVTEHSQHDAYGEITALRNRAWAEWYGGEGSMPGPLEEYDYNQDKANAHLQGQAGEGNIPSMTETPVAQGSNQSQCPDGPEAPM